jgi:hypothetical protein
MEQPIELSRDWSGRTYVVEVAEQCQRVVLVRCGEFWCELIEAVPGSDRYPPGRCTRIALSEEVVERVMACWQAWRSEQRGGQVAADGDEDAQPF